MNPEPQSRARGHHGMFCAQSVLSLGGLLGEGPTLSGAAGGLELGQLLRWWKVVVTLCALFQYEMYTIERNAERTATAGRLLYDM